MALEPGTNRYVITGTITAAEPAQARLFGYAYKVVIVLALIAACWLLGQRSDEAAPAPAPGHSQPADLRTEEAHK